jgi:hypothetical protein
MIIIILINIKRKYNSLRAFSEVSLLCSSYVNHEALKHNSVYPDGINYFWLPFVQISKTDTNWNGHDSILPDPLKS